MINCRCFLVVPMLLFAYALMERHGTLCWAQGFEYPLSVTVASDETLFVADRKLPGVWKVAAGKAEVYFRASKQFRTPLNAVRCVAVDRQENLLAGDSATREVYRFDEDGKPQPLTDGNIGIPIDIAISAAGDIYVADLELHRVVTIRSDSGKLEEFVSIPAPRGLCFDTAGQLWIVSHGPSQLVRVNSKREVEKVVDGRPFAFPHCVAVDDRNIAYVADGYGRTIWKIPPDGKPEKWITSEQFGNPVGLAISPAKIFLADPRVRSLFSVDLMDGKLTKLELEFP